MHAAPAFASPAHLRAFKLGARATTEYVGRHRAPVAAPAPAPVEAPVLPVVTATLFEFEAVLEARRIERLVGFACACGMCS